MTEITLDLVSMDSAPLPTPRSCRFEGLGGTIGRDEGNTLVLQDKHRRGSRLHASVTFPDGVATSQRKHDTADQRRHEGAGRWS